MRCLLVLILACGLAAEEPFISDADWQRGSEAAGARSEKQPSMGSAALALGMGLAVVLAIGGGVVLMARHLGRRRMAGKPAQRLQLLESLPIGFKQHIHLVRLGDQVLVLGSHERGLTAITTVPAEGIAGDRQIQAVETSDTEPEAEPPAPPSGPSFAQAFSQAVQAAIGREKK